MGKYITKFCEATKTSQIGTLNGFQWRFISSLPFIEINSIIEIENKNWGKGIIQLTQRNPNNFKDYRKPPPPVSIIAIGSRVSKKTIEQLIKETTWKKETTISVLENSPPGFQDVRISFKNNSTLKQFIALIEKKKQKSIEPIFIPDDDRSTKENEIK